MLKPLDRHRRDSTLFQFTTRRLRDFIDPDHLLIRIDEQFDFARLGCPLEDHYCLDNSRPAIHPEVMVRALLICSLYNISSFTRLSSAIAENIAYRCFCFLTIDDPVFDHSTISYFIERIGRDGFAGIFNGLNEELLRLGLLSPGMYADTCLVNDITADPADPEAEGARMTRTLDDFGVFPDSCVYCKGQRYIASEFGRYYEAIGRHSTPNPIFRRTKLLNSSTTPPPSRTCSARATSGIFRRKSCSPSA